MLWGRQSDCSICFGDDRTIAAYALDGHSSRRTRSGHSMSCFISRKKDKIATVFTRIGPGADEETFISTFKQVYPKDWIRINEKWLEEENNTPPGKKHPMQHPDVYMKEMYRNHRPV